ncbi:MAG: heme lyase CcmF/NrfE family subunit [Candidatus Promineifilaceae bacterium]
MLADIGFIALDIAFVLAVYATVVSALGGANRQPEWVKSARNAAIITFPMLTIPVTILVYALYTMDFSLAYVVDVSSRAMSNFLRLTALWGGQEGSILFWGWLMSGFVMTVLIRKWDRNRELMPFFITAAMLTTAFFIGLSVFIANPFARLWHVPGEADLVQAVFQPAGAMPYIPLDGRGLNPLLRHFGMIGHPPTTYLGFTGFVIPFSFAISALITGKSREDEWIRTSRRWTLVAWIFLSIGLVLGGRWAYDVLGWGGFWGWDPVENAMLMPWLTGTAFLHSVMITEKRGMLKVWSVALIILTYSLSLFGTFITRTGVIGSVHAFGTSALGPTFFVFIGVTFIGSLALMLKRLDTLKTEHELQSFVSRESVFLLQNLLFLAITFVVFWGTGFPILSELFVGEKITVGPPYFKKVTGPLFFALLLIMGIAPFFAWRKQTVQRLGRAMLYPFVLSLVWAGVWGYAHQMHPAAYPALWLVAFVVLCILFEFWKGVRARMAKGENPLAALGHLISRNHRRYGGYIIHLGVVMIGLGFIGDGFFKQETQVALVRGESLTIGEYSLRFDNLESYSGTDGREVLEATTSLYKNGEFVTTLKPRRDYFVVQQQPSTIADVYSTAAEDVYVLLVGWEDIGFGSSTFKVFINPLISWTWAGGFVLILGTIIAAWPQVDVARKRSYVLKPQTVRPQLGVGD